MVKKKLIAGTLAGLIGLGTYLQFGRPSIESVVKREFDSFPTEIEGAKSVKKYETEGAKYCLIHIKQFHVAPQMPIETRLMTGKVQSDIYSIISKLSKQYGLDSVYVEGETQESLQRFKSKYEQIKQERGMVNFNTMLMERAWMRLCVENVCEIVGGEKEQMRQEAREVLIDHTRFTDGDLKRIVLDNREDAVLDIVSSNKQRLAGIIYGEGHNWNDNIKRWNIKHPDKKFALIEVTPKSIVDDEAYWGKNTDPLYHRLMRLK